MDGERNGMNTSGMPSAFAASDAAADAWRTGRNDADNSYAYSRAYWEPFWTEAEDVPVTLHMDLEREAYRDGFRARAQDLADGSADD